MAYPKTDWKKFYLPIYITWVILGPALILISNYPFDTPLIEAIANQDSYVLYRVTSIFLIFGLVWPIMIVVYPAFYDALLIKFNYASLGEALADPAFIMPFAFWAIAFYGPFIWLFIALFFHRKAVITRDGKDIPWKDFLMGFV